MMQLAPLQRVSTPLWRYMMRLINPSWHGYTEMMVDRTVINNPGYATMRHFDREFEEDAVLIPQLASNSAARAGEAAKVLRAAAPGISEINLNVGCPSAKVADRGAMGAELMNHPELVGDICDAIGQSSGVDVSVKCRTGVINAGGDVHTDGWSAQRLLDWIGAVSRRGNVRHFIVHARHAHLGKSPRKNRQVPALQRDRVDLLQREFPQLRFTINGEIDSAESSRPFLDRGLGVMVGRGAMKYPMRFAAEDSVDLPLVARKYAAHVESLRSARRWTPHVIRAPLMHLSTSKSWHIAIMALNEDADNTVDIVENGVARYERLEQFTL